MNDKGWGIQIQNIAEYVWLNSRARTRRRAAASSPL